MAGEISRIRTGDGVNHLIDYRALANKPDIESLETRVSRLVADVSAILAALEDAGIDVGESGASVNGSTLSIPGASVSGRTLSLQGASVSDGRLTIGGSGASVSGSRVSMSDATVSGRSLVVTSGSVSDGKLVL